MIDNNRREPAEELTFVLPADLRVKLKGSLKRDKYLDVIREQKKQWNMKVMVIAIGALGAGSK